MLRAGSGCRPVALPGIDRNARARRIACGLEAIRDEGVEVVVRLAAKPSGTSGALARGAP
ncbi:MAG: hypothetical protein AB7Q97_12930 [Gammaproteobacteria bacterium]